MRLRDDDDINEDNIIQENRNIRQIDRLHRYLASYSVFFLLHAIQMGLLFYLDSKVLKIDMTQAEKGFSNTLMFEQIFISTLLAISKAGFDTVAPMLTEFEKHRTWIDFRYHNCFKLALFRLTSIFLMTFLRGYYATGCTIEVLGYVYLVHVITDLVVSNIIEWAVPLVQWMIQARKGNVEEARPQWDTDEEYLEIIYRQFVIYSGMAAFPMISLFGLIISALEIYLDKARLIYICKKPKRTNSSMKAMVTAYMLLSAILAVANWGGGALFMLNGNYWAKETCPIHAKPVVVIPSV
jgi:hypothetical protein